MFDVYRPTEENTKNRFFPIFANKTDISKNLKESWITPLSNEVIWHIWEILDIKKTSLISDFSKKLFLLFNGWNHFNENSEIKKDIYLFQYALIEMEWFFHNIKRLQKNKTWFDHIIWVINNMFENYEEYTVKDFIVAALHDAIENIPWYSEEHIVNIYWSQIADRVYTLSKKNHISDIDTKYANIYEDYYNDMTKRDVQDIKIKFEDRIDWLKCMHWVSKNFIARKIQETELYFIKEPIKQKVWEKIFNKMLNALNEISEYESNI
jgi:hypothetical protein